LEECKTFLDWKKMPPPAAPVLQEPRQEDFDGDEQMWEIDIIFGGSMSLASKTQGKKLQHEIILA
jgi:hypothetical protein